jgi:hypothetical protein
MSRTHDTIISSFDLDRLEAELADVTDQRDCAIRILKRVQEQRDRLAEALRTAFRLIVLHHECGVQQELGCYCPVCHHKDGTEPEIDQIKAALDAVKGGSDE